MLYQAVDDYISRLRRASERSVARRIFADDLSAAPSEQFRGAKEHARGSLGGDLGCKGFSGSCKSEEDALEDASQKKSGCRGSIGSRE